MRIAILTFHRAYNCGAMLQAWALKTVFERMGHRVEFPNCNHVGDRLRWPVSWRDHEARGWRWLGALVCRVAVNLLSVPIKGLLRCRYAGFRRKFLVERNCLPAEFGKYYDLIVVGSDQVWSERHTGSDAALFFGENFPSDVRRIAYSASYGDAPLKPEKIRRVVLALENFSAVSVREKLVKDQLSAFTDKKIKETVDPTLLLEAMDYDTIAHGNAPKEPYLFMYTLSIESFFVNTAKELACRLGIRCVIAPCDHYSMFGAPKGLTYGISPDRLVQYVRNAKYVLAGSFHGTVMGALFNKPFLSLRGRVDSFESRPAALLRKLGCENRLVNPSVSIDEMLSRLVSPLPDVEKRISDLRQDSFVWLQNALTSEVDCVA